MFSEHLKLYLNVFCWYFMLLMAILHQPQQKLNKIITIFTYCRRKMENAAKEVKDKKVRQGEKQQEVKAKSDRIWNFGDPPVMHSHIGCICLAWWWHRIYFWCRILYWCHLNSFDNFQESVPAPLGWPWLELWIGMRKYAVFGRGGPARSPSLP